MGSVPSKNVSLTCVLISLVTLLLGLPGQGTAQDEVTSDIRRYRQYENSTGYYEEYEVRPRNQRPLVSVPGLSRGVFSYSPIAASIRIRSRLSDSHRGLKFYDRRQCVECHVREMEDVHTTRANLTCRQCHGGEPIASINHYYSPLNPIRRHAYVCAKCHEGAGVSFAAYIVHEPPAGAPDTLRTFPILYYTYWFMLVLLLGTLAFFIPHSFALGLRELLSKRTGTKS